MNQHQYAERVEQIKERLYRTAFLYMGSEAMAADAVAEAVYRGLIYIKKLRQPEFFNTWMTRILINECNKLWRRAKREEALHIMIDSAQDEKAFEALPLKEAIHRLPQELREVIILRFYSDFTMSDTAKCLNIPQGTVATRQRRALKILQMEFLKED
jgi:RNA polymerase sigma-70 factor (ECF subfamily)